MAMKLQLTGPASFASPLTYGTSVKNGQIIKVSDDDGASLLSIPDVFTLYLSNLTEAFDFTDDAAPAQYQDGSVVITPALLAAQPNKPKRGVQLRNREGYVYGTSDGLGGYKPTLTAPQVESLQVVAAAAESGALVSQSTLAAYSAVQSDRALADKIASEKDAAGFLQKTTIGGPTYTEIQAAAAIGSKLSWIQAELLKAFPRRFMEHCWNLGSTDLTGYGGTNLTNCDRTIVTMLLQSPCALRAKCLHSLTKLFVISYSGGAFDDPARWVSWLSWYDRLDKYVFGNWRDMLQSITYSLHMSRMLTYYANEKETPTNQPDENYAREIMQLFTIGLHELNMDGTYRLDSNGARIPTYNNADIRQVARCLTGLTHWEFNNTSERYDIDDTTSRARAKLNFGYLNGTSLFGDPDINLVHYLPFYEYGSKLALGGRLNIPANTDPVTNLSMLHDALFNHPNTAPFFAVRMIRHMVTSNPSPAYVGRVAAVFANNGFGVRGDLKAVWTAIFTDPEAASDGRYSPDFGRVRDGFDLWSGMIRPLERKNSAGGVSLGQTNSPYTFATHFGAVAPRMAPSIFYAYNPLHVPTEYIGLSRYAPELQQWSAPQMAQAINELHSIIQAGEAQDTAGADSPRSDYSMLPLAGVAADLIERLNLLLMGGKMGPELRASLLTMIGGMSVATATNQNDRVAVALQVMVNSPDYFVQL